MIIKSIKYFKYYIPLKQPIITSTLTINERSGFIIRVEDSDGNVNYGEAAPLEGFSNETLQSVELELKNISNDSKGFAVIFDPVTLDYKFENLSLQSPSLLLAFEQALLFLMLGSRNLSLENFGVKSFSEISFNGFISIDSEYKTLIQVEKLILNGFDTIKLKIGRKDFLDDFKIIKSINDQFGSKLKLRLDANGKWNKSEAISNLNLLKNINIEYVEQPCAKLNDLSSIVKISPVEIAVDESIKNIEQLQKLVDEKIFKYIVIKPMLLGNLFGLIKIISRATKSGQNIILSSIFETSFGKMVLLFLSQFTDSKIRHGFATDGIFVNNFIETPLIFDRAKMSITKNLFTNKLSLEYLFNE